MPHGAMGHEAQEPMDHGSMEHMDQGGSTSAPPPSEPPPRALEGPRHAADAISSANPMAAARYKLPAMDDFILATNMLDSFEAGYGDGTYMFLLDPQGEVGGDLEKLSIR